MEIKISEPALKALLNIKEDAPIADIQVAHDSELWVFDITEIPMP